MQRYEDSEPRGLGLVRVAAVTGVPQATHTGPEMRGHGASFYPSLIRLRTNTKLYCPSMAIDFYDQLPPNK